MITFTAKIKRFNKQGEKTGWTYIDISPALANKLNPGTKLGYRVKGMLDAYPFKGLALLPMGQGAFILTLNAKIRKAIGKAKDDVLNVKLERDDSKFKLSSDFIDCLRDEPRAMNHFKTLSGSHQRYFSKWIEDAKTIHTKTKRITMAVNALAIGQGFPEMLRANRKTKD